MTISETILEAVRGEDTIWEFDITTGIDAVNDELIFTAKHEENDALDDPVLLKGNTSPLTGLTVVNPSNGLFTVQADADELVEVAQRALIFDVLFNDASVSRVTLVAKGTIRLLGEVIVP